MRRRNWLAQTGLLSLAAALGLDVNIHGAHSIGLPAEEKGSSLWPVYENFLKGAKYVDLTHTITPLNSAGPCASGRGYGASFIDYRTLE